MEKDIKKKYLTFEELKEMEKNTKITNAKDFWKANLLSRIVNVMETGEYRYELTEKRIDKLVYELFADENIYETIDFEMAEVLMKYEKKVRCK